MAFWVYILRCADNSYYTGHTDNLEKRLAEHMTGAIPTCYTYKRRPVELVFSQEFATREEALASERQIKGWSRKKKEAMMRGDWAEVSRLAQSKTVRAELSPIRTEPVVGEASPEGIAQTPNSTPVRAEPSPVRAEPVEAQPPFDKLRANGKEDQPPFDCSTIRQAHSSQLRMTENTVRAEPVEAQPPSFDCSTIRQAHSSQLRANGNTVRAELVEAQPPFDCSTIRQAHSSQLRANGKEDQPPFDKLRANGGGQ